MSYIALTPTDLAVAALLLVINGVISLAFRLGLERSLAFAAVRMVVQLAAVGIVLRFVFEQASPLWTLAVGLAMALIAGHEVVERRDHHLADWWVHGLGSATLLLVGLLGTLYAVVLVIKPEPWHAPRYVLPILGMVLGNTLTSVSLVLQVLAQSAYGERRAIEARLALGASRFEALIDVLRRALKTALTPVVNAMAVAGVVTLPGMMTGQILSGVDPGEAAKYQILIMFVISGAAALGAVLAGFGGIWLLTDHRHRLRLDRLRTAG